MRKTLAISAALGVAALGVLVPTTSAQASTACDTSWNSAPPGSFYAYDFTDCSGLLGRTAESSDANWGDSSGPFQGNADNAASSILHKGTSGMAVKVYQYPGYLGGHACLKKSESYKEDLSRHTFSNGAGMDNDISSHRWVWESACGTFLD
ncbi:hypothetical protein ACFS5L_12620 [Streptomyces phyllanthi]|uniref:Secreted protein n=1 Tax=Streptomyces phyllanthi TaxID=1803180 RepID=A0A5N8WAU0_9ACTN|nr:hypothetical protein [Streptomyces phyllanthi]MPY44242.1 hypothetical protein [Streptomyces phyllanthi]